MKTNPLSTSPVVRFALVALILGIPKLASANVVWPGLLVAKGMLSWAIPAGLAIESVILRRWLRFPWGKAIGVATLANVASALFGAIVVAAAGFAWELGPGQVIYRLLGWGTFNPLTWAVTILFAAMTSTVIEILVIRRWWPERGSNGGAVAFFLANIVTTMIAVPLVSF